MRGHSSHRPYAVLICLLGLSSGAWSSRNEQHLKVTMDQSDAPLNIPPYFLSNTVDVSQLLDNHVCNLSSPVLRKLASHLQPSMLRFGGTEMDRTYVDVSGGTQPPAGYARVLSSRNLTTICEFANAIGFPLLFGINAGTGPRGSDGRWQNTQLVEIMGALRARNCSVHAYEFGNEPNLFRAKLKMDISAKQYGEDAINFSATVKALDPHALAVGFDADYMPVIGEGLPYQEEALRVAGRHLDAVSWHFYPTLNDKYGKHEPFHTTARKLLEPLVLDQVGHWARKVNRHRHDYAPQAAVWLGETSSAVGGGEANVSNAFVDAFEYLDKLGQAANAGHSLVARQTLCGYNYGLIDWDLTPNPSFYAAVLFKQLVRQAALPCSVSSEIGVSSSKLRAYAYCSSQCNSSQVHTATGGPVVFVLSNLHETTYLSVSMKLPGPIHIYRLSSSQGLKSRTVELNGIPLETSPSGELPDMKPALLPEGYSVELVPQSYAFVVFPEASDPRCQC